MLGSAAAGRVGDTTQPLTLLDGQAGATVFASKTYDDNALRAATISMGEGGAVELLPQVAIPHGAIATGCTTRSSKVLAGPSNSSAFQPAATNAAMIWLC
ncbi:hypothetical protein [Geminicoccus flavidas]|uniref:hypothetical protein n=1 Tax=Geminicoccus flavidas TaxID=2506407 RepID=UPI00135AF9C7|nr:hypothetical protein [Geminicoccus flavidas]